MTSRSLLPNRLARGTPPRVFWTGNTNWPLQRTVAPAGAAEASGSCWPHCWQKWLLSALLDWHEGQVFIRWRSLESWTVAVGDTVTQGLVYAFSRRRVT